MRTGLVIGVFALAVVLFFADVIFSNNVLLTANTALYQPWRAYAAEDAAHRRTYRTDSILTYLPRQAELSRGVTSGRLPLWNPYILAGTPFLADPQARVFYPISLLLAPFDPEKAMGYDLAVHFFLAILGMYLFLRAIRASTTGSMIGAVAYGFSSFFFARMGHPTFVASAAWIPFLFYGYERARRSKRTGTLLLAAFFVMGYLAGFPQVFMFGVAFLVLYACYLAVDHAPRTPREIGARGIGAARIIGVAGIVSLLVVGIHLVPFAELLKNSVGLGIPYNRMAATLLAKPVLLLRLVFPNLFGNPVEETTWLPLIQQSVHPYNVGLLVYCGTGTLLAALGSLAFLGHSRHVRVLLVMLLVSMGIGMVGPVLKAAYAVIPWIGYSQIDRIAVVICFAVAALGGMGFSLFTTSQYSRAKRIFLGIAALVVAAIVVASAVWLLRGEGIVACVPGGSQAPTGINIPVQGADRLAQWIMHEPDAWLAYERKQVVGGLAFALVSLVLLAACGLSSRRRRLATGAGLVFLCWAMVEVGSAARTYYVSQPAPGFFETEGTTFLRRNAGDLGLWRVAGEELLYPVFPPNTNQIFGLQSVWGRATIMPRAYAQLMSAGRASGPRAVAQVAQGVAPASDLAGFMGVRYVLDSRYNPRRARSPILEAIATSGGNVRILGLGGESRVAFCQAVGEPTAVGLMIPQAQRLDFLVGLAEAPPDMDSVVVVAQCAVGSATAKHVERLDAAACVGRWRQGSLDISSLGAGHGSLTLAVRPAVRPAGESGDSGVRPGDAVAAWSALEFVFADCPARQIAGGYAIQPAGRWAQDSPDRSAGDVLSLDVTSRAGEVGFEIRTGSHRMVRRLVFGSNLTARTLLIDLGEAPSGELTVVSDSAYSLNSARTAYYPRAAVREYDLVYSGDMHVFENSAATARAVCLGKSSIRLDDSGAPGIIPAAALIGRIGDVECGRAEVVSYEPERIEVRVSADRDCYLFFQDTYYPGWRAYVDGSEAEIFMTDVGTRALEVASGDHRVVMKFRPSNFWIGLGLSCLGLVLGTVYAAKGRFHRRAKGS